MYYWLLHCDLQLRFQSPKERYWLLNLEFQSDLSQSGFKITDLDYNTARNGNGRGIKLQQPCDHLRFVILWRVRAGRFGCSREETLLRYIVLL